MQCGERSDCSDGLVNVCKYLYLIVPFGDAICQSRRFVLQRLMEDEGWNENWPKGRADL